MTGTNNISPKISVIVPVYNSEQYLPKCIDSILAQTYTDFELILVNDGSKDESGDICDEYAQRDARVRVFHKKNGGVSSARNLGLDESRGEWIAFVDSDDWVSISYLNNFISDIDDKTNLIMHGKYLRSHIREIGDECKIFTTSDKHSLFEELKITPNGQICSKFFRNAIIKENKLRFNQNISLSEDTLFILKYISCIEQLKYRSIYHYNYRYVEESLSTTNKVDFNSNLNGFKTINKILFADYNLKSIKQFPTLQITYFAFFTRAIKALCVNKYNKKERIRGYKELLNSILFPLDSLEYGESKIIIFSFSKFKKERFYIFDYIMSQRYNRGKIISFAYSIYKKQKK